MGAKNRADFPHCFGISLSKPNDARISDEHAGVDAFHITVFLYDTLSAYMLLCAKKKMFCSTRPVGRQLVLAAAAQDVHTVYVSVCIVVSVLL